MQPKLEFTPATGYKDMISFPDPETEAAARAQIQELHDQTRDFLNNEFSEAIDKRVINAKSDDYTVVADDLNETITMTGTKTVTLPLISTEGIGTGFRVRVSNVGSGTVTVAATSTDTIAGSASVSLAPGKSIEVVADAAGIWTVHGFDFTALISTHKGKNPFDDHATNPSARVYSDANQSIPSSAGTVLSFNQERLDTDNIHDNVTNNTRLTAKTAGKYLVIGNVVWADNATGLRMLRIIKGGSIVAQTAAPTTSNYCAQNVSAIVDMAVNDYVTLQAFQNTGSPLDVVVSGQASPEFMMVKVG